MPYITQGRRMAIIAGAKPTTPGELNFFITTVILSMEPKTYAEYNSIIGVLECVKQELYRRAVAPYEDAKIKENGDVYP